MQFFFNFGLLLQYGIGPYLSYLCLIYLNLSISVLFLLVFLLVAHETPYFLIMNNRLFKAEDVLRQLRNHIRPLDEQALQNELSTVQVNIPFNSRPFFFFVAFYFMYIFILNKYVYIKRKWWKNWEIRGKQNKKRVYIWFGEVDDNTRNVKLLEHRLTRWGEFKFLL